MFLAGVYHKPLPKSRDLSGVCQDASKGSSQVIRLSWTTGRSQLRQSTWLKRYLWPSRVRWTYHQRLCRSQYKYGFQTTEKIAFGLIKLSILFLWRRIFGHVRTFNIVSWVMVGIIIAWSLTFFIATVFQCGVNWSLNWAPITLFLTECSNTLDMLTVFTATDIITDLLIIAMPIPMVCKIRKDLRTKILRILDLVTPNERPKKTCHQRHVLGWIFVSVRKRLCLHSDKVD